MGKQVHSSTPTTQDTGKKLAVLLVFLVIVGSGILGKDYVEEYFEEFFPDSPVAAGIMDLWEMNLHLWEESLFVEESLTGENQILEEGTLESADLNS